MSLLRHVKTQSKRHLEREPVLHRRHRVGLVHVVPANFPDLLELRLLRLDQPHVLLYRRGELVEDDAERRREFVHESLAEIRVVPADLGLPLLNRPLPVAQYAHQRLRRGDRREFGRDYEYLVLVRVGRVCHPVGRARREFRAGLAVPVVRVVGVAPRRLGYDFVVPPPKLGKILDEAVRVEDVDGRLPPGPRVGIVDRPALLDIHSGDHG
mmetsp:Transcript_23737/g.53060  ORF Transcript_23737/g.53060 Transcript_23737/m.53060 type:complete len:211 (+) Transcript_23737:104-736(+)